MIDPIKVDPYYLTQGYSLAGPPEKIQELDEKVKPEFRKHLKNDNWRNPEYRKQNKILISHHPAYYYETVDGEIIFNHPDFPDGYLVNYNPN